MASPKATNLPTPISSVLPPVMTLSQLIEPIASELNESLACVAINADTCDRILARDPANVAEARECARRGIRASTRAANAVSRLKDLFSEKDLL